MADAVFRRGSCGAGNCECRLYRRRGLATMKCECGHVANMHCRMCLAEDECKCAGFERGPPSVNVEECSICGHDEEYHYKAPNEGVNSGDAGAAIRSVGSAAIANAVCTDEVSKMAAAARVCRREQHERRYEQMEGRTSRGGWGGSRAKSGRRSHIIIPPKKKIQVTPCQMRQTSSISLMRVGLVEMVEVAHDCTLNDLKDACREAFQKNFDIYLSGIGERIFKIQRGLEIDSDEKLREYKPTSCWYYNPNFEAVQTGVRKKPKPFHDDSGSDSDESQDGNTSGGKMSPSAGCNKSLNATVPALVDTSGLTGHQPAIVARFLRSAAGYGIGGAPGATAGHQPVVDVNNTAGGPLMNPLLYGYPGYAFHSPFVGGGVLARHEHYPNVVDQRRWSTGSGISPGSDSGLGGASEEAAGMSGVSSITSGRSGSGASTVQRIVPSTSSSSSTRPISVGTEGDSSRSHDSSTPFRVVRSPSIEYVGEESGVGVEAAVEDGSECGDTLLANVDLDDLLERNNATPMVVEEVMQSLSTIYGVSVEMMEVVRKVFDGDGREMFVWFERNFQDKSTKPKFDEFLAMKLFEKFCGWKQNDRPLTVYVDRFIASEETADVISRKIARKLLFNLKRDPASLNLPANVNFEWEEGVGEGLVAPYCELFQKHIFNKKFEGDEDHRIPRKCFEDGSADWKYVGRMMGHVMRQKHAVCYGLSDVFKELVAGIDSHSVVSISNLDFPNALARPVLKKLMDGEKSSQLDDNEKEIVSELMKEHDLSELIYVETGTNFLLPKDGKEKLCATTAVFAEVLYQRESIYRIIRDGINEVCPLNGFMKLGMGDEPDNVLANLTWALMNFYFPSRGSCVPTRSTIRSIMTVVCDNRCDDENKAAMLGRARTMMSEFINGLKESVVGDGELTTSDFLQWCTSIPDAYPDTAITVEVTGEEGISLRAQVCFRKILISSAYFLDDEGVRRCLQYLRNGIAADRTYFGVM